MVILFDRYVECSLSELLIRCKTPVLKGLQDLKLRSLINAWLNRNRLSLQGDGQRLPVENSNFLVKM